MDEEIKQLVETYLKATRYEKLAKKRYDEWSKERAIAIVRLNDLGLSFAKIAALLPPLKAPRVGQLVQAGRRHLGWSHVKWPNGRRARRRHDVLG